MNISGIFFLKAKNEAVREIINFIKNMENLNSKLVKQLRSDHGTEFRNEELKAFVKRKEFHIIFRQQVLLKKMESLIGETEHLWNQLGQCSLKLVLRPISGLK